jgi:hypothetical protein
MSETLRGYAGRQDTWLNLESQYAERHPGQSQMSKIPWAMFYRTRGEAFFELLVEPLSHLGASLENQLRPTYLTPT